MARQMEHMNQDHDNPQCSVEIRPPLCVFLFSISVSCARVKERSKKNYSSLVSEVGHGMTTLEDIEDLMDQLQQGGARLKGNIPRALTRLNLVVSPP